MPRLKVFSGRELLKLLQAHGFEFVRQKGSHMVVRRVGENGSVTLPIPDHKELAKGTLTDIIRQSGLAREIFEEES